MSVENTRAALYFANAAKNVVMRPHVNEVADDKAVIRRMQAEIESLKRMLVSQSDVLLVPPLHDASSLVGILSSKPFSRTPELTLRV